MRTRHVKPFLFYGKAMEDSWLSTTALKLSFLLNFLKSKKVGVG